MQMVLFKDNKRFIETKFKKEEIFENLILANSKVFFGNSSLIIDLKKKIGTQFLGGTIPDFFLMDLTDPKNPEFYLVEVELSSHDFFRHIFPQITKFFAFFKNPASLNELIEKIYNIISSDQELKTEFYEKTKRKEIYKYIKDMMENSQNILLILDENKKELPEIIQTYTDTWGKMVKTIIIKEFKNNSESIYQMSPDFENIEVIGIEEETGDKIKPTFDEAFHLDGVNEEVLGIYHYIKDKLLSKIPGLAFNSQHYYISIRKRKNFAYIIFRKKKIRIVVMQKEELVREKINNHTVKTLSEGIQRFYNAPCCDIIIEKNKNLKEIINLLVEIQK